MSVDSLFRWFSGGSTPYMTLQHCMNHDTAWILLTVSLDLMVASGYVLIALHWSRNERHLPPSPARKALANMRNIFAFCGVCGYLFIPIKMVWPAWRLYDLFMIFLVYYTWKYAWGAKDLKVVYNELVRTRKLADDLEKSREESRRKSFFLNAISHDLRTPLNGLMLQVNLAEVGLSMNDRAMMTAACTEIRRSAQATADLLNSFLELARLDWSEDKAGAGDVSLHGVVQNVFSQSAAAAATKGLQFHFSVPAHLTVHADRVRLERILMNLVTNAIKFTEQGEVRIEARRIGRAVEIHVTDTGIGIPTEHQGRLFEEFFQVHNTERDRKKGFGLGLAISRRLARQIGGDLTVHSTAGRGSCFTVTLPTTSETSDAQPAAPHAVNAGVKEMPAPAAMSLHSSSAQ